MPYLTMGEDRPRCRRQLGLWTGDLQKREDHPMIMGSIAPVCCEIEKAPDMGPHDFRTEVVFAVEHPSIVRCSKTCFFQLDTGALINEFIKEEELLSEFTVNFEIKKNFNKVTVEYTLWHSTQVWVNDLRRFRGCVSYNPVEV